MSLTLLPTTVGTPDIAEPEPTLRGSWRLPIRQPAPPPVIRFVLPEWLGTVSRPSRAPTIPEQLQQVKDRTGWSLRTLGALIDTTHPTVEAVLAGRTRLHRTPGTARRVWELYQLVSRLWTVAGEDSPTLDRLLTEAPGTDRRPAIELFRSGDVAGSYLAALDVLRPPQADGMMRSLFPARPGQATAPLHE